jgi:hypothetical protein
MRCTTRNDYTLRSVISVQSNSKLNDGDKRLSSNPMSSLFDPKSALQLTLPPHFGR